MSLDPFFDILFISVPRLKKVPFATFMHAFTVCGYTVYIAEVCRTLNPGLCLTIELHQPWYLVAATGWSGGWKQLVVVGGHASPLWTIERGGWVGGGGGILREEGVAEFSVSSPQPSVRGSPHRPPAMRIQVGGKGEAGKGEGERGDSPSLPRIPPPPWWFY